MSVGRRTPLSDLPERRVTSYEAISEEYYCWLKCAVRQADKMTMRRVLVATSVGLLVAIFPLRLPAALATSRPVPKASEYVSAIDHTLQAVESVNAVNGS